tara:strand:+ start:510 stop:1790 length:1281 start_codon:yes stop_codon:yes gene_type:complete
MMKDDVILKVENLSKQYRLGLVGTGTISHDLNRFLARIRGKDDPYLKIGESNDRSTKGTSDYVWALKDINFEVKSGEVLGIIGKNGAGKSTLLKILSKVTGATTGSIKSKGRIASLLEVGTGFHPEMTGKENIFLNGAILGMTKKEIFAKFNEIVEFSGCERYIDTPVKRYSSGMKVRLAFAIAAFLEPDILVIDEVLAVGDAEFQKKAIGKMQDISNADGRTVLFVSHDMTAVKNLCDRLIVLNNGAVEYKGDVFKGLNFYNEINIYDIKKDLKNREDREGNQKLKFTSIKLNEGKVIKSGDQLKLSLYYHSKIEMPNFHIAITICKGYDNRIFSVDNLIQGEKINIHKGIGILEVVIPKIYLLKGIYSVNIWCNYKNEVVDYIIDAANLFVEANDIYLSGKELNSKQHGFVYVDKSKWRVALSD